MVDRRKYSGCVYRIEPHRFVCDLYLLLADGVVIGKYSTLDAARAALEAVAPTDEQQSTN